jgi:hypothetical protein
MAHEDAGHYASKHPEGTTASSKILSALDGKISDRKISCTLAHEIAQSLKLSPKDVGIAIDLRELKLAECQLGLFGHQPGGKSLKMVETIPSDLEKAIRDLAENNKISCYDCWDVAERQDIPKLDVASACEKLGLKISPCQLGAF